MTDIEHVTTTVQIMQILSGDPPRILTGEWLHKQGKRIKFFQQLVPVRDADLYARFTAQVCKGDRIQVTIATEWSDAGYSAYLADFALVSEDVREHQDALGGNPQLVKSNAA